MKKKLFWAIVALLGITAAVLIATWPCYLPAPYCFPNSVFTPADMRAQVDCHPKAYKREITKETVVLFAFPVRWSLTHIDWVGPIFIIHVPSVSEVVLSTDGSIRFEGYKSSEGRSAIEDVLNNPELMASILERAKEIEERRQP